MKKSKKYAALMAAALLVSGAQFVSAADDTIYLGGKGKYGETYTVPSETYSDTYENKTYEGDGSVGAFYVSTKGDYDKSEAEKAQNKATFTNVKFVNNTITNTGTNATTGSTSAGAAVFVKGADVTFENVQFTNNTITGTNTVNLGGAVMVDGVRNNHNYTATATFKVTEDMTYSGNKVSGVVGTGSDTWGSVAVTSGGFLYLDRGATANFNISDGATLIIGEGNTSDKYTDSIASSIKESGQTYSENAINKTGGGTLTVNGQMQDYHGDLTIQEGTMNINSSLASDSVVSVYSGATLNLKKLALSTSAAGTQSVVKPDGSTQSVTTPEKSGKLDIASGATVTSEEITASGKTSVSVGEGATLKAETISAAGEAKIDVASDATVEAEEIKVDNSAKLNVASGATVKADAITANESSTVEFASGSNVNATMYVGNNATVKALGNFSGKFYNTNTEPQALSESEVQEILGVDTTAKETQQLVNGSYAVNMNVGSDGKFSLSTIDTSAVAGGGSAVSHELGTWDTKGNYTAYGDYDANGKNISNVDTLSAKKITLNGADIASGKVASGATEGDGSSQLVTGKTMYEELRPTDGNYVKQDQTTAKNLEALDAAIGSDADYYGDREELNNISTTTANPLARSNDETPTTLKENIGALDAAMGKVSKVGDANDGILDKDGHLIGSSDSGYGANLTDAVLAVDERVGNLNTNNEFRDTDGKLVGKYNVLDSKESLANNLEFIDHALGTTADGAYVSSGNSVGQNLNALDQGLSNLDRGLSDLGDRLNKVGAGAAALAALHPEGFDPDDKLSFAVGYGHYKNANASAIGAFYKPNRDTTFSIASTIGNGSTMLNAGVSFKIGKSSHVEKTMVAKADYEALQQKVAAQDEKMAAQDAQIEELKKQVALLVAKG